MDIGTKRIFLLGDKDVDELPSNAMDLIRYLNDTLMSAPDEFQKRCVIEFENEHEYTTYMCMYYERRDTAAEIKEELERIKEYRRIEKEAKVYGEKKQLEYLKNKYES